MNNPCPGCRTAMRLWRTRETMAIDLAAVASHHACRWPPSQFPQTGQLKDTTELMYGVPAAVQFCPRCSTLARDPATIPTDIDARYRDDPYPAPTLDRLWECYTAHYRRDRAWLGPLLRLPSTSLNGRVPRLLEIGSHVGAFLAVAGAHGWDACGLDVGTDVTGYARARRVLVRQAAFDPAEHSAHSYDAVWILNCFEHYSDPLSLLSALRDVLRPGGLLVLRTPRAEGIHALYGLRPAGLRRAALAVNNALGVPFPRCLSQNVLVELLTITGYRHVQVRLRQLVPVAPRAPVLTRLLDAATTATIAATSHLPGSDARPWMDLVARAPHQEQP
jgi:SAM-dependent methyltransferase